MCTPGVQHLLVHKYERFHKMRFECLCNYKNFSTIQAWDENTDSSRLILPCYVCNLCHIELFKQITSKRICVQKTRTNINIKMLPRSIGDVFSCHLHNSSWCWKERSICQTRNKITHWYTTTQLTNICLTKTGTKLDVQKC